MESQVENAIVLLVGYCVLVGWKGRQRQLQVPFRGREVRQKVIAVHRPVSALGTHRRRLETLCNVRSAGKPSVSQRPESVLSRLEVGLVNNISIGGDCRNTLVCTMYGSL